MTTIRRDRNTGAIESRRIPFPRRVELCDVGSGQTHDLPAMNLSMSGIFAVSETPLDEGSEVDFRIQLDEGATIEGSARVAWRRSIPDVEQRPAGMGLQFLRLDPKSRRLLRGLVEDHFAHLGRPVEAESSMPADGAASAGRVPSHARWESHSEWQDFKREKRRRRTVLWVLAALVLVGALLALSLVSIGQRGSVQITDSTQGIEFGTPTASTRAAATQKSVDGAEDLAHELPVSDSLLTEESGPIEAAEAVIEAWSEAWSEQRADDYLAHYSSFFDPPGDLDRAAWQNERRTRVESPRFIRVTVYELDSHLLEPRRVRIDFVQVYRSNLFSDIVDKTVELVAEDNTWKIVFESSREDAED